MDTGNKIEKKKKKKKKADERMGGIKRARPWLTAVAMCT
jgi:hypothetical protein